MPMDEPRVTCRSSNVASPPRSRLSRSAASAVKADRTVYGHLESPRMAMYHQAISANMSQRKKATAGSTPPAATCIEGTFSPHAKRHTHAPTYYPNPSCGEHHWAIEHRLRASAGLTSGLNGRGRFGSCSVHHGKTRTCDRLGYPTSGPSYSPEWRLACCPAVCCAHISR
ncbi:hypothetical protein LY76DRAFT_405496 [Colletotrichum caudatum]|nr:hypothetical protein LY76DRAFT_405496 [Colletotrichum caudatum]